jgi:hypothetical protein
MRVAPGVGVESKAGGSVAGTLVGVRAAACVFCACTVMATDVAMIELLDADDPHALSTRERVESRANNTCLIFRSILISFHKQRNIIPVLKRERPI